MSDIRTVRISAAAQNKTRRVPEAIQVKLKSWVHSVNCYGLWEVRRLRGFRDEALKGQGQRCIRLSKSYRAIYVITSAGGAEAAGAGAMRADGNAAIAHRPTVTDRATEPADTREKRACEGAAIAHGGTVADRAAEPANGWGQHRHGGTEIAEVIEVIKHRP